MTMEQADLQDALIHFQDWLYKGQDRPKLDKDYQDRLLERVAEFFHVELDVLHDEYFPKVS